MKFLTITILLFSQLASADSIIDQIMSRFGGGSKPRYSKEGECIKLRGSTNASGKSINIVFVPSGFNGEMDKFESSIREFWTGMEAFEPFAPAVDSLNVFVSKYENSSDSFCSYNGRLLNCSFLKAQSLGRKCHTEGKKQVITIHNSTQYGGEGGISPSASIHPTAVSLIVHELGHSLFRLSDEYEKEDAALLSSKNCSSQENSCSKWQDLIDAGLAACTPGCKNNASFVGNQSIMRDFSEPTYGHVNQRLICCVYKEHTGEYPEFCGQYQSIGQGLDKFCRK